MLAGKVSTGLSIQEKKRKIDFGFPIGTVLAIFDLQVTSVLKKKFQVNWPFGSGEEEIRFSRWLPSWLSNPNNFSYF